MPGHQTQTLLSGKQIVVAKASIDAHSLISCLKMAVGPSHCFPSNKPTPQQDVVRFNSESMAKLAELPYSDSRSSFFKGISILVHEFGCGRLAASINIARRSPLEPHDSCRCELLAPAVEIVRR
jgi:hypothetical protein